MSDQKQGPTIGQRGAQDDGAVESLLRLAGAREPVPADRMQRLKAGAHAEWRRQVSTRRRRHVMRWSLGGLAAAAALVLALRATMGLGPASPAAVAFMLVESLGGNARLATDADAQRGAFLKVGDRVAVGPSRLSLEGGTAKLRLPGGSAVWVDRGSALRVTAVDVVVLDGGAVYIDSRGTASLEIRTPLGVVRDVGTKFEVRLTAAALRVRVRDGAVLVRRDQQQHDAGPGDEMLLGGHRRGDATHGGRGRSRMEMAHRRAVAVRARGPIATRVPRLDCRREWLAARVRGRGRRREGSHDHVARVDPGTHT